MTTTSLSSVNAPVVTASPSGYLHPLYAQSFNSIGNPRPLNESGAWILERQVPNSHYVDAMGCYPLFLCGDWSRLHLDLDKLENQLVSLSIVADPFGDFDLSYLQRCFPDLTLAFKDHFVIDLSCSLDQVAHPHHLRNARKAAKELKLERCVNPANHLEEWTALYNNLVGRHRITGIAAFSSESFAFQLRVPGLVAFRALHNKRTVGMLLWYAFNDRAFYHLGAYSSLGYELRASFALFYYAIRYFTASGFQWLDLGGAAGIEHNGDSGLSRFKRGWSTGTRVAYLCGRILNRKQYAELVRAHNLNSEKYFPAYRAGEFRTSAIHEAEEPRI